MWLSGLTVAVGRLRLCVGPVQRACGAPGRGTGSDFDPVAACPLHHGSLREITSCWTNVAEIPAGRFGKSVLWSCFGRLSLGVCLFHHFALRGWRAGGPTLFFGVLEYTWLHNSDQQCFSTLSPFFVDASPSPMLNSTCFQNGLNRILD